MHSVMRKISACALAALLVSGILSGCGSSKLDGTERLLTVNDESVDLGVGSFMARYQQASVYTYWGAYLGTSGMFDTVYDESTNETYGDTIKDQIIDELKLLMCIRQHAEEYNVSLTDDETAAIEKAAQAYIDDNDEKVRNKIGASKDDVIELLNLQTIQSKMMDPIVADVDTNVDYADIQQTTVTYVAVSVPSSTDSASSSAESTASSASSSDSTSAQSVEASVSALQDAQSILDQAEAESDPANADLDSIASSVNSDYSASTGQFTTNDTTDTTLDSSIVESVSGLEDGTLVDHVVESSDGETYYVVRLDKNNDEDASNTKKEEEITQRKQDKYDEVTQGWVDAATVDLNEEAWAKVVLTDEDPFGLVESTADSSESAAESGTSSAESVTSSAESGTSSVESGVSSAQSAASSASSAESGSSADSVSSDAATAASSASQAGSTAASTAVSSAENTASSEASSSSAA